MTLHHPIDGPARLAQHFGANRAIYRFAQMEGHNGLDFEVPEGTPVHAAANGAVVHAGPGDLGPWSFLLGNSAGGAILIHHRGLGLITGYAHLSEYTVRVGEAVKWGDVIGLSGATGHVGGPHLHFEVLPIGPGRELQTGNGYLGRIDPLPLLGGTDG